ncbi:MAG: response regulator receiver protein [Verrucomicrobiales bacterium]|nr:response regulator receiver protein [Verrucomicrobiales bacterium]
MITANKCQPVVLYLENNPDDRFFLERQVNKSHVCFDLVTVSDSQAALEFLHNIQPTKSVVILLDYTLDGGSTGLDVLRWIHQQPVLRDLTTVMYSSGEMPDIVTSCYQAGVHYFVHKCPNLDRVRNFVECLDDCLRRQPVSFEALRRLKEYARPYAAVPSAHPGVAPPRANPS